MTMRAATMGVGEAAMQDHAPIYPAIAGFFFVFRAGLTFLFFQSDPVTGTAVTIGIGLALVYGAILQSTEDGARLPITLARGQSVQWIFAMLGLSLASVMWTAAASQGVALAYWAGTAADVAIALLLLRGGDAMRTTEALMQGAVWGAVMLAVVAWCSPATAELRLGNDEFLHPNTLGLELGLGTLTAQYFVSRGRLWKWVSLALAITLLRTLSKTAIVAFVAAECWVLMQHKGMTRRAKMQIAAVALVVVASLWGVLTAYLDVYNGAEGEPGGDADGENSAVGHSVFDEFGEAVVGPRDLFVQGADSGIRQL